MSKEVPGNPKVRQELFLAEAFVHIEVVNNTTTVNQDGVRALSVEMHKEPQFIER